jgi:hypothetical protein
MKRAHQRFREEHQRAWEAHERARHHHHHVDKYWEVIERMDGTNDPSRSSLRDERPSSQQHFTRIHQDQDIVIHSNKTKTQSGIIACRVINLHLNKYQVVVSS